MAVITFLLVTFLLFIFISTGHCSLLQQIVVHRSRNCTPENKMLMMMIEVFLGFPYVLIIIADIIHSLCCVH